MRRILIAIGTTLTGLVLLFSFPTSLNRIAAANAVGAAATGSAATTTSTSTADADAAAAAAQAAADAAAAAAATSASGTYDGAVASTRFGEVQVRITVVDGVMTASEAIAYPGGDRKNVQISSFSIPILNQEAVAAGSANIAMVSGATYTSGGYIDSLQSALDQAGL
ncbi:FMN-binding protein [Pengzhenrongella frigida]|uniref:FMN-binding protein n=1 Tax=Pengzhenrongella frigida TaxID=1259133 RepID=A0A4Q5MY58_9MICO|nr:FMN-binding protein [Cellulomonas sp. HLT2-17]RYV50618.1 FMN-binding protein [Cellulomonas sp. HLT2-17]